MTPAEMQMRADVNDPRHGTINGYSNHRCRCERCRIAWAAGVKSLRERRTAKPTPARLHGTENGYSNYGCRCRPCTDANSTASYARARRRLERNTA